MKTSEIQNLILKIDSIFLEWELYFLMFSSKEIFIQNFFSQKYKYWEIIKQTKGRNAYECMKLVNNAFVLKCTRIENERLEMHK